MKKSLLMIAACAFMFSAIAQKPAVNNVPVKKNLGVIKKNNVIDAISITSTPLQQMNFNTKADFNFTPVRVNSSGNLFSMLVSQQNMFAANQELNLLAFSHRGGPINGLGGQVLTTYSINGGTSFNDTNNIVYDGSPNPGRYPSGIIYNPIGNTTISDAYSIVAGPGLNAAADQFTVDYFAWKKFGSTPAQKYVYEHQQPDKRFCRLNLQATNAGTFWMTGDAHTDDGTNYTAFKHILWKGVMDQGTITWADQAIIPNSLINDGNPTGRPYSSVAFSEDGQIGYFICFGIPAGSTNYSYRPMVKKTTDGGTTWNDLADFDFSNLSQINEVLPATNQGPVLPFFDIVQDAVVDKNGQLHFTSFILPGSSTDVDSIGYIWTFNSIEGYIYDTYTTDNGWDTELIDIVYAKVAEDEISAPGAGGDLEVDSRLQMAISPDRSKIFFTWADTDPDYSATNQLPDLFISGFDVDTKYRTESFNVTKNTALEASAFFHSTAPQAWKVGSDYLTHNIITNITVDGVSPVNYIYLKDVKINESDFAPVSVRNIDNTLVNVSQNYPNPTNGMTSVDVSITKPTTLSIEVVNMMGQVVYTENKGKVSEGKYRFNFDASKFNSGIYFYTVKANDNAHTSKMMVQ